MSNMVWVVYVDEAIDSDQSSYIIGVYATRELAEKTVKMLTKLKPTVPTIRQRGTPFTTKPMTRAGMPITTIVSTQ